MSDARMRHCGCCGAELGVMTRKEWDPGDTCGAIECERYAREQDQAEREEAHENLDRMNGWGR